MARILSITVDLIALSQTYVVEADDARTMTVVENISADEAARLIADNADHAAQLVENAEVAESLSRLENVAREVEFWKRDDEKVAALTKRLTSLRVEHDALVARHADARSSRSPAPAEPAIVVHVDDKGGAN